MMRGDNHQAKGLRCWAIHGSASRLGKSFPTGRKVDNKIFTYFLPLGNTAPISLDKRLAVW